MSAGQHTNFSYDWTNGFEVSSVDALAGIENVPAHDLGFEFLEHTGNRKLVIFWLGAFREEMCHHLFFHGGDGILAILLLPRRVLLLSLLVGPALSVAIETAQLLLLSHRAATVMDVVANSTGATFGVVLALLCTLLFAPRSPRSAPAQEAS